MMIALCILLVKKAVNARRKTQSIVMSAVTQELEVVGEGESQRNDTRVLTPAVAHHHYTETVDDEEEEFQPIVVPRLQSAGHYHYCPDNTMPINNGRVEESVGAKDHRAVHQVEITDDHDYENSAVIEPTYDNHELYSL